MLGGTLKQGKITINGKKFYLSTSLVADNLIKENYISKDTKNIYLNEIDEGATTLIQGVIKSGDYSYPSSIASAIKKGNINNYSISDNEILFTGIYVNNNGEEIQIRKKVNLTVDWYGEIILSGDINIKYYAFAHCLNIKGINETGFKLKLSGHGSFLNCSSLEKIINTYSIGFSSRPAGYNFAGCENIKPIDLQIENLFGDLFRGAKKLEEVNICLGVTTIERGALAECPNLKTVRIPSTVTNIDKNAFYKTENIQDIYVDNTRDAVIYADYLESICQNVHYLDSVYTIEKTAPENVDIVDIEISSEEGYKFNSTYKFKVAPKEGYTLENVIVKVNIRDEEKEIIPQEINGEKVYIVENIQNNIKIEVKADVNLQSLDLIEENS